MIKRLIACLTICLIVTGLISPVFSDASALPQPNWSDPGISEVINISDLTNWMLNGGIYDVSRYTDAESFMNDYFNARTQIRLTSPDDATEDYYEVLPGFGISNQLVPGNSFARPLDTNRVMASSFRDHTGYGRRFSAHANEALLDSGSLYDMKIPLLNEVEFANFVGYNHDALRLYSEFFSNDSPQPRPDPGFEFISNVNTCNLNTSSNVYDFNSFTWAKSQYGSTYNFVNPPGSSTIFGSNLGDSHSNNGADTIYCSFLIPIVTINVDTSNPSNVIATYSSFGRGRIVPTESTGALYLRFAMNSGGFPVYYVTTDQYHSPQTTFSGLSSCINYIYSNFANINLYVDGKPWVLYGTDTPQSLTPEFPDAVGGEELPTTTWPISRPRAPYYTSVPGMLQAIEDAIQGDGKLDIDDLKPYLTDENGDPVPDPIFDPEPVPIPVPDPVNPDVVPGLPELPVIPLEMPGYNGVSVLAEIINFTNQSLPTSLIVTFWGIVFGIVILGLIKILHK